MVNIVLELLSWKCIKGHGFKDWCCSKWVAWDASYFTCAFLCETLRRISYLLPVSGFLIQAKSNFSWALLPLLTACWLHIFAWFAWKMFLNIGSKNTKLLTNFRLRLSRSTWFSTHPEGHAFWSSLPINQVILCLSFSWKPKWTSFSQCIS